MKKSPANVTDAELLKLLDELEDSDTEAEECNFDNSVLAFISTFKLKPGKDKVTKKNLYKLYNVWNKSGIKITQANFTLEMSKYFEHKTTYYLIDTNFFEIAKFIKEEKDKHSIDKSKSKYWHNHFTSFLEDTKLEEGTVYIELEIFYYLYTKWTRLSRKKALLSRKQFIKILDLYFDVKAIAAGNNLWVGLNEQIKNLVTKQEVERWRKTRVKKNKKYFYPQGEWKQFALYWEEKNK